MRKSLLALLVSLVLLLSACGGGGQAPQSAPEPESPSASVSEPAPEPESEPEPFQPEPEATPFQPEPVPAPEPDYQPLPPQGEVNPDTAPDFGDESYADVVRQRAVPLRRALETALEAIKEDYSSFEVSVEDGSLDVVLELGVINEEAVDHFLANWTGLSWDKVEKSPGSCSAAKKEAFIRAVDQLELEPGLWTYVNSYPFEETLLVGVRKDGGGVTQEEEERWAQLPQAVKNLAQETGVPEELLDYMPPRYRSPLAINPD